MREPLRFVRACPRERMRPSIVPIVKVSGHTPPPPAARRGPPAAHPPPLRRAHGSETAPPCAESAAHGHARRSGCVLRRGSGQPAPPSCRSRLRSAGSAFVPLPAQVSRLRRLPFAAVAHSGCAVCPSRRSHTPAAPSALRGAAHTQPTLWAWPAGRVTCAGRGGSSRRRALCYDRRAAALPCLPAGGGGVWASLAAQWGCP